MIINIHAIKINIHVYIEYKFICRTKKIIIFKKCNKKWRGTETLSTQKNNLCDGHSANNYLFNYNKYKCNTNKYTYLI